MAGELKLRLSYFLSRFLLSFFHWSWLWERVWVFNLTPGRYCAKGKEEE
jgi:hypothetical protein